MDHRNRLKDYKLIVNDAFWNAPLNVRQRKAASILSEALKRLSVEEFKELERNVFERLEK